jgi:hypothetical protein
MTEITNFSSLLIAAEQQPQPQRLLFVFLQATEVSDHSDEEGQRGLLKPIMCVDKNLPDLTDFANLVEESKAMGEPWEIALVTSLSGSNGKYPDANTTDQALNMMVKTVESGGNLSNYLAFDKSGGLLSFN